jgi:aminopeptidase N
MNMYINIQEGKTIVTSELSIIRNPTLQKTEQLQLQPQPQQHQLVLDGDETSVQLISITLNGQELVEDIHYKIEPGKLILYNPLSTTSTNEEQEHEESSILITKVQIVPESNTQLSGLYKSGPMYCTQCEAMGFRRITYYPDRPDNVRLVLCSIYRRRRFVTVCIFVIVTVTDIIIITIIIIIFNLTL